MRVEAVEELFALFESGVVDVAFAVLLIVEPVAADGETCAVMVKVALAPPASVAMLHDTVGPVVQVNAGPVFCANETKLVFAGSVSVQATVAASEGPALATAMV